MAMPNPCMKPPNCELRNEQFQEYAISEITNPQSYCGEGKTPVAHVVFSCCFVLFTSLYMTHEQYFQLEPLSAQSNGGHPSGMDSGKEYHDSHQS